MKIDINSHKVQIDVNCLSNKEKEELLNALRPKGRWVETEYSDRAFPRVRCTRCGKVQEGMTDFCEDCGSDMRRDAE